MLTGMPSAFTNPQPSVSAQAFTYVVDMEAYCIDLYGYRKGGILAWMHGTPQGLFYPLFELKECCLVEPLS